MEWHTSPTLVDYETAMETMENQVDAIIAKHAEENGLASGTSPLYTAGTSAKPADLLDASRFPGLSERARRAVHLSRPRPACIGYAMLDLARRAAPGEPDIRQYVQKLESWLIATLAEFGLDAFTREGRIGVWVVDKKGKEAKIAALGIRVRKWVTYHGIAINHSPDLSHYAGITCPVGSMNSASPHCATWEVRRPWNGWTRPYKKRLQKYLIKARAQCHHCGFAAGFSKTLG